MGKTAYVNLSQAEIRVEPTADALLAPFLGGRGYGARLLFTLAGPTVLPLAPENPLIFTTGPFSGTPWPAASRYHLTFKSPLTGIYGYANAGGFFGPELARAGYDALVITGQADSPVYLAVTAEAVRLLPAADLWGLTTSATAQRLASRYPAGARIASIGPAGEQGVRFAAVINDGGRAAARCGGGAVMGAKRLKAVVVQAGGQRQLPEAFRRVARQARERLRSDPRLEGLRRQGTAFLIAPKNVAGDLPARNHQWPQFPAAHRLEAAALDGYLQRHTACFACPIACSRLSHVPHGPHTCALEGPEYETVDALGPMTGLADPEAVIYANFRCNELGLDTISTGVTIAFALECHERGLIQEPGLSLEWGDPAAVLGLIERIAARQGLGDLLAEGVRRAAENIGRGAEALAMHVKGLELPRQEPRIAKGFGLGHATANRGADHLYALPTLDVSGNWEAAQQLFPAAIVPELMDTAQESYKPDLVVYGEHFCALSDALGVCKFSTAETYSLLPDDLAAGLSALWGRPVSGQELLTIGERIVNLERLYNVRQGLSRRDDRLPERFTQEPVDVWSYSLDSEGRPVRSASPVRTGAVIALPPMLDRYYQLRGWTPEGIPTPATLERLGLHILQHTTAKGDASTS
jgi:aldehyde:ferredoxin oxidoreductase